MISLAGVLGSLIVWRMDVKDWDEIRNLSGWKLDLVTEVAQRQNQPLEQVRLRQADIVTHYATD